jgi:hypothetical protein
MNFIYPAAKTLFLTGQLNLLDDTVLGVLVSAFYAASQNHASLADIPPAYRIATTDPLANKTVVNGTFCASPATAHSVSGNMVQALVLVASSGTDISSPLIAYLDTSPGLPVNPTGGDLVFNWTTTVLAI